MLNKNLQKFLDENNVKYQIIPHSPAYTAQEIAQVAHIAGQDLAKTVIIKLDGKLAMLVVPAHQMINFMALKEMLGAKKLELASEYEFQDCFKDCEVGAMPPFGNLYKMDVFVEDSLLKDKEISFNAGNHKELVKMNYDDWATLVKPRVVRIH
jgi:Ala-tRNA(Pro) deacylase